MSRRQKNPLRPLTDEERAVLLEVSRARSERAARRQRARARRHALGGSGAYTRQPIPRHWPKVA